MGNRAVILPRRPSKGEPAVGIYVHWNGGIESVLGFCKACKELDFRSPAEDKMYGMARLCQVIANFFGGTLSIGLAAYTEEDVNDKYHGLDNGFYILGKGWEVKEHFGGMYADEEYNRCTKYEDLTDKDRETCDAIYQEIMEKFKDLK